MTNILSLTDTINSSESGSFVFARMTTERMYSISATVGMMVYATDLQEFYYYNGIEWIPLAPRVMPGTMIMFGGTRDQVPNGYLLCDGGGYNPYGIYNGLFNVIGRNFGNTDNSTYDSIGVKKITGINVSLFIVVAFATEDFHNLENQSQVMIFDSSNNALGGGDKIYSIVNAQPKSFTIFAYNTSASSFATAAYYRVVRYQDNNHSPDPYYYPFTVPDTRGMFPRGVNYSASDSFSDPDAATRVSKGGSNSGNNVGSYQLSQIENHRHPTYVSRLFQWTHYADEVTSGVTKIGTGGGTTGTQYQTTYDPNVGTPLPFELTVEYPTNNGQFIGGFETRPKNFYVNFIIKY